MVLLLGLGLVVAGVVEWGVVGVVEFGECVVCGVPPGGVGEGDVVLCCVVVEVVE